MFILKSRVRLKLLYIGTPNILIDNLCLHTNKGDPLKLIYFPPTTIYLIIHAKKKLSHIDIVKIHYFNQALSCQK